MNKHILLGISLLIILAGITMPVSAEILAEGDVFFEKSAEYNVGYNIIKNGEEFIWVVWNSENLCKIIPMDGTNRDMLVRFKDSVDKCLTFEAEYAVDTFKSHAWWNLKIRLTGMLGQKYSKEDLDATLSVTDQYFLRLQ